MTSEKKVRSQQDDFRRQLTNALGADAGRLSAYFGLYENTFVSGALCTKVKRLIALAMAIGEHDSETVTYPVREAMDAGANREEISEVVTLAVLLAGVPSLLTGLEALALATQIEAKRILSHDQPITGEISRDRA